MSKFHGGKLYPSASTPDHKTNINNTIKLARKRCLLWKQTVFPSLQSLKLQLSLRFCARLKHFQTQSTGIW